MALNLNHPDGIQDAMQTAVRASRLEILVRQMSTSQTIVSLMCNRVLSILLASIAEAIAFSSVELANALNLDMSGALLLYFLYDRMHLKDCRGMAISSPFAGHKTAAFCTDKGGEDCIVCSQYLKCNALSALLALHGVLARSSLHFRDPCSAEV